MVYLLLALIAHIYFYKPSNTLACGLFGWSGANSENLDRQAITILGLFNQSRGDDAIGLMTNTDAIKSSDKGKFSDFISSSFEYEEIIKDNTFVLLGHTRNASPGTSRTEETAQPCVMEVDEDNSIENLNCYGLIHNGNIKSAASRLEELGMSPSKLSDSYDFHSVLMDERTNVIEELSNYTGKAALAWTDDKSPGILYLFKGSSKMVKKSTIDTEERPLFYTIDSTESLYFSSTKESLIAALKGDVGDIIELEANVLYTIEKGAIINMATIDRSNSAQTEPTIYSGTTRNSAYGYYGRNQHYDEDDYYGAWDNHNTTAFNPGGKVYPLKLKEISTKKEGGKVAVEDNRYVNNKGVRLNGFSIIKRDGSLINKNSTVSPMDDVYLAFFIDGSLIKPEKVSEVISLFGGNIKKKTVVASNLEMSNLLGGKTGTPFIGADVSNDKVYIARVGPKSEWASGTYNFPFVNLSVRYSNGELKAVIKLHNQDNVSPYETHAIKLTLLNIYTAKNLVPSPNTRAKLSEIVNQFYGKYSKNLVKFPNITQTTLALSTTKEEDDDKKEADIVEKNMVLLEKGIAIDDRIKTASETLDEATDDLSSGIDDIITISKEAAKNDFELVNPELEGRYIEANRLINGLEAIKNKIFKLIK